MGYFQILRFVEGWGEPGKVVGEASNEGARGGVWIWGKFEFGELLRDEKINWVEGIWVLGEVWFAQGSEGPPVEVGSFFVGEFFVGGPGRALLDPVGESLDLGGGERGAVFGHCGFGAGDHFDELTRFGEPWGDGAEEVFAGFKDEITFGFGIVMAAEAVVFEDGCDLSRKIDGLRGGGGCDQEWEGDSGEEF